MLSDRLAIFLYSLPSERRVGRGVLPNAPPVVVTVASVISDYLSFDRHDFLYVCMKMYKVNHIRLDALSNKTVNSLAR